MSGDFEEIPVDSLHSKFSSELIFEIIYLYHTKIVLEHSGCRTRQPGRTWLLGPGAVLVLNPK